MNHLFSTHFGERKLTKTKINLHKIYWIGFLIGIGMALLAYIQSSYLAAILGDKYVGLIYAVAAGLTLIFISYFAQIINKFGNYSITIFVILTMIAGLLIMAAEFSPIFAIFAFIIYLVFTALIYINLDIFLENFSKNEITGTIRGTYWTLVNFGWLISPIMSGWLLERFNFSFMFKLSAGIFLIPFLIIIFGFKKYYEYKYHHSRFLETLKEIFRRSELRNIFALAAFLQFFYAWMVIYAPIYLHEAIGLSWPEIGVIFTIMLIPFVIIEYPAGFLADKYWGEKEMLILGMFIMSVSSFVLFFVVSKSLIVWAFLLFITRIGASLVEVMRDSYFFKQISVSDIHLINFFRNTGPFAYVVAPALASIILFFYDINFLFLTLGAIMLLGSYFAIVLKDTK